MVLILNIRELDHISLFPRSIYSHPLLPSSNAATLPTLLEYFILKLQ